MLKKIIKVLAGLILFHIAIFIYWLLTLVNFCLVRSSDYFRDTAKTIDQYGNRDLRKLWNATLIRKQSTNHFGNIKETISSVLGKNQKDGTLTYTGKFLTLILDIIDKDHCKNAIEEDEIKE